MKKYDELHVTVSNRTILRIILFSLGTFMAIKFIGNVLHPLTLIFVSFFLALALNPAVSWFARKLGIKNRAGATAIAYTLVLTFLVGFFILVIPPLVRQTTEFIRDLPTTLSNLETQDSPVGRLVRRYDLGEQIDHFSKDWANRLGDIQGPVWTTANRIIANLVSAITVLVLTFMMLVEGPSWLTWFYRNLPEEKSRRAKVLIGRMSRVVTGYVNGQVLVAIISGTFSLIALLIASSILNVSVNAVALAAIVTVLALVPTIGNIISAFLITLVCLFSSTTLAIIMLIYFIVYQQIENATIQPYIQSRSNELTALTVFIAALLGIGFGGLLGGLVAIPIAGCVKILFEDWLDDRKLNASIEPKAKKV